MSVLINHLSEMDYLPVDPESQPPENYSLVVEKALQCRLPEHYREFLDYFPRTGRAIWKAAYASTARMKNIPTPKYAGPLCSGMKIASWVE